MPKKPAKRKKREKDEKDEGRVAIPLDPEEALRALLKVDPEFEPASKGSTKNGSKKKGRNTP